MKSLVIVITIVILAAIVNQAGKWSASTLEHNAFCAKAAALGIPGDGCK